MRRMRVVGGPPRGGGVLILVVGVVGLLIGIAAGPAMKLLPGLTRWETPVVLPSSDPAGFQFSRLHNPDRTEVIDRQGIAVATFTDGARTVTMAGPLRTISEPRSTSATVETSIWVRVAPEPWHAGREQEPWVRQWLSTALADSSPDVLAIATEYTEEASDQWAQDGVRFAGNANFGPELDNGKRDIGADFYDYLGHSWRFPDGVEKHPNAEQAGALDCSGYLRMVYGYRSGYPLSSRDEGIGLPRRADTMARSGPGTVIISDRGARPTDFSALRAGDLLFFTTDDDPDIDHSAIYLGRDSDDRHRFISSRGGANGPTMGDFGGASVLQGDGFFAERLRAVRRI
ncbi:C40 family peptidase [Actinomycetospora chibensis]|uniref:C40 family peptidase n=1 Tax=Actinomycetospora chibensis TaxID=663606 RepID=A0ABV9RJF6_9PSEU|nr:NlpC/P60 family protein [Actinomycetospora chibensis]MDD7926101.1 NlpC/P60 family protein [Actinomycetospora chibensis]